MTRSVPTRQVPGLYRQRCGDAVVTVVCDGVMPANLATLLNIEQSGAMAILHEAGRTAPLVITVNVFVVQTPTQTVLIDTGCGQGMTPTTGQMMDNLHAAGIQPGDIDVVLMTHLHRDHAGGLLTPDGKPAFPNAALVVPETEVTFWLDEGHAAAAPEDRRPSFELARRKIAPYGARMRVFTGSAPVPGIEAVPLPGHTPGHTGYVVGSGEDRVLIWGDIVHYPDIQSRRPDVAVLFDVDPAQAIATRRAILARAADERLLVAGMHTHFPAFVRIAREGDAFAVQPIAWLPGL